MDGLLEDGHHRLHDTAQHARATREFGPRREIWTAFSARGSPLASPWRAQCVPPNWQFFLCCCFHFCFCSASRLATERIYRARSLHTTSLYKESCEPVLMCFPRTPDLKTQRIPERPKPSQSPSHAFKRARCERARCERARCERARCERGAMRAGAMPDHYTRNQVCPTAPQALVIHTPCPVEAHRARTNSTTQSGQVWDKVWLWARCKRARCEQARCEPQSQTNPSGNHHVVIQGVT